MKPTLTLLTLAAAVAAGCGTSPARTSPALPPVAVTLTRAELGNAPARFEAGGVVRARMTTTIAARVLAPIFAVPVRPGDRVRKGQTLVTLDGRDLQAQAERAAAALVAAGQGVRAATAEQQGADASAALAAASFERVNGLHARRSATNQEFDDANAALQIARARQAGAGARQAEAAASLTAAQSAAGAAAIAATYATVTAPFDGVITERFADPGAMATPAAPLLTIEDTSAFRLEARVDEARASAITIGQAAEVRLDHVDLPLAAGRVTEVSRTDAAGHGFLVKIDLAPAPGLRSGAFGRAVFTGPPHSILSVPAAAIVSRGQLSFAFLVGKDGVARLSPVTVGALFDGRVEVMGGVSAGDQLVLNPPPSLTDGSPTTAGAGR